MKYGLLGKKLAHSYSKTIHESFAPYEYELKELTEEELDSFMKRKEFSAVNVTIPYKETVMKYLSFIDDAAKEIGSVNTVVNKNGVLYGYNTDFYGLRALLLKNGFELENKKVLVLGSGGTSKTAAAVCRALGAREIYVVSRSGEVNYQNVLSLHSDAQYIINTTPCGMFPNNVKSAISLDGFDCLEGVCDVIYNPLRTSLLLEAKEKGLRYCGGLYMLVMQAVKASGLFLGTEYDESTGDSVYRKLAKEKENIVLTGMPGSGKSTIGLLVAKILSRPFADTDKLIIEKAGMEISDIFSKYGEEYFRTLESEVIAELSKKTGLVISTGGGAVLKKENIRNLSQNGKIFFLDRPLEQIVPTSDRPLSSDELSLKKRFEERYDIYKSTCDERIPVDGVPEHAAALILGKENHYENSCPQRTEY